MAMSVDGLASGLDTTSLITKLMSVESMPQTALKNKITAQNKAVTAYQSINTKMAALVTASKALTTAGSWGAVKATSSSDAAGVSAGNGAATGSLTFKVDSLAAAHTVTFGGRVTSATDATGSPVITGGTMDILLADGSTTTITPADASLSSVVKKINETPNAAYKAAAVQVSPGQYTLQLTATESGANSAFATAFANGDPGDDVPAALDLGAAAITAQGADAQLTVGTTNTYTITSASNTFTDVIPGVTVTANKVQGASDNPVTVTIGADPAAMATKVQALVDAANAALTEIATQTKKKSGDVAAGPLAGDATMRKLSQDITGAIAGGGADLGSFSKVGIEVDRYGKITFNKDTFNTAYSEDSLGTQALFDSYDNVAHANASTAFNPGWDSAKGVGRKLEALSLIATEGVRLPTDGSSVGAKEGILGGMIKRKNDFIGDLNDRVAQWDSRLEIRRNTLERQFTALETALSSMQQQSSWLAGQINSLPS
ncbi:flagellar hook-associated protein 2 [Pilimelia anulata]|uniref:Flagellar hook-associated protein 2 n=1 Tax=Pilimelia anulata TaxID=53371 RepID=A0A8J3B437_9ACTN|nr:flagellar filament capping protein FliD [Pilimelia anulata]GGJ82582.1 flagellar hook-associated protein 2 [Pilimelia anulata]